MNKRIDFKILWEELREKIREFYPYFFGFYLLSLVVSIFSKTWKSFFYWPAFHGAIIIFTVLFLLTFKLNWQPNFKLNLNLKNLKPRLNLKENYLLWRAVSLKVFKLMIILAKEFFNVAGRVIKNYFFFIKKKISAVSKRSWLKIIVIVIFLLLALFEGIGVLDFIVLFYALISFLFVLDSRAAAGLALILLASCPFWLIFKKDILAESAAIYAYYFLIITVLTQIRELKKEKNASIPETEDKI
ncbi:MAG: hypothetical protein NTY31_03165 [Candidatus Falkowbacteria bacterium]|nr:hypothetical protein [Candidatus Falkowbacteria bacterium]